MTITTHTDADGMSAGFLYGLATEDADININNFGEIAEGSTAVLDMHPTSDPDFKGICIDHHPDHPTGMKLKYKLYYDTVPTSAIVWNNFHEKIPHSEWWKAAIGCVGDMQSYSIPTKVWNDFPILREKYTQLYGWKHTPFSLRVYQKLSSGLNALSRMGQAFLAMDVLEESKYPMDLITDPRCEEAREVLKKETNSQLSDMRLIEYEGVTFGYISSELSVGGRIATQLSRELRETVLVQNLSDGAFSIRGDLTSWIADKIAEVSKEKGITVEVGGHPQAKGGTIDPPNIEILTLFE